MILVLSGTNTFAIQQVLRRVISEFDGTPERVDGTVLELRNIPDLLMGGTLFAEKRLVIIRDLASNTVIWSKLPDWLARVSDDVQLVLVEDKLDKRTSAFKALKKAADVQEYNAYEERDRRLVEAWLARYAEEKGLTLDKNLVTYIVARAGLDQWQLAHAVEKLLLSDTHDKTTVDGLIEPSPSENIFALFETALNGDGEGVQRLIRTFELTEDPYATFALLSSQAFQLAAIATAGPAHDPSKDFGIHPFVASKMARHARQKGKQGALRIVATFAQADADMKISKAEPWLLVERALLKTAQ